uniref:Uncharacterized protein n=1 Tax=Amphimedon queenslandica TaxID=400682 RepID=A0A1X7TCK3_AMPQE
MNGTVTIFVTVGQLKHLDVSQIFFFYCPKEFGATDYKRGFDDDLVDYVESTLTTPPVICSDDFKEFMTLVAKKVKDYAVATAPAPVTVLWYLHIN